jgi:hypothetical protein
MRKNILISVAIFALVSSVKAYAYDDGDFQIWNTETQELKINKDLKVALEEEFRWGDNANQFFYHHYDAGVSYSLNKYLGLGGGYRHIYELSSGKFKLENEPYVTATLSLEKAGFALESRNRVEYRHFDFKPDSWRYRNKFTLKFPWKFGKLQVQPYIGDEILASFASGTNQINQNRLSSGLGMKLTTNIKAEIYYMLVSSKSAGRWTDSNVLGTKLKISF